MRALATITLALAMALPAAAQPVTYTVIDLGPAFISAINASGQTTGTMSGQAYRASPTGQVTFLGNGNGNGINDLGQVTGNATSGGVYLTTPSGDLSTASYLGTIGGGVGVNNSGQVVGAFPPSGTSGPVPNHAYRTVPGGVIDSSADLGTLPGGINSYSQAINSTGQATGYGWTTSDGSVFHAFRTSATGNLSTADDLGTLGGAHSQGTAINASGQVAGVSNLVGDTVGHAFRSSPNGQPISLEDLGSLGGNSIAYGINSLGVVVGAYQTGAIANERAFIFDTQMQDLSSLVPVGWTINQARGINDSGWIAANGSFNGGSEQALVLIPVGVPEPSTLALAAAAGALFAGRRVRRDVARTARADNHRHGTSENPRFTCRK